MESFMKSFFAVSVRVFFFILGTLAPQFSHAQVISPSARELMISYETQFVVQLTRDRDVATAIDEHSSHLFGVLHSPHWNKVYGLYADLGGIAAPRLPAKTQMISAVPIRGSKRLFQVRYRYVGILLVHKKVAQDWLNRGQIELPMPYQVASIYNEKCTDEHYSSLGDYWYFYDPFRRGCEYLLSEPYHRMVSITVRTPNVQKREYRPDLGALRGDNGNGSLMKIAVIHGFNESDRAKSDEGRIGFNRLNADLKKGGFSEEIVRKTFTSPLHIFRKKVGAIDVEIHHLLATTDSDARTNRFAQFFKESIETADVLMYLGHSGLGANLDIESLESRVGEFQFQPNKKQILFFDSCASYSYYLELFKNQKRRSKIDVVTNGLSSYFEASEAILRKFLNALVFAKNEATWLEILTAMESPLKGDSYLINVGGI